MRPHGRAIIDESDPRATALCDRCKKLYNRDMLTYQYDWAGQRLVNKRLLVCETCLDEPAPFLKALVLPPDPTPILDSRVLGSQIDFKSFYTLTKLVGTPSMFSSTAGMAAEVVKVFQGSPAMGGVCGLQASVTFGAIAAPALAGVSSTTAATQFGALAAPALSSATDMAATAKLIAIAAPAMPSVSAMTAFFVTIVAPAFGGASSTTASVIFDAIAAPSLTAVSGLSATLTQTIPSPSTIGSALGEDALGGGSSITV